jgi:hypothetical protein
MRRSLEDVRVKLGNHAGARKPFVAGGWSGKWNADEELIRLKADVGAVFPVIHARRELIFPAGIDAHTCHFILAREGALNSAWSEEATTLCPPFKKNQLPRLYGRSQRAHRRAKRPGHATDPLPSIRAAENQLEMVRHDVEISFGIRRRRARKKYLRSAVRVIDAHLILASSASAPEKIFRWSFALSTGLLR